MNPNDILAQQQALLNQVAHNSQQMFWGVLVMQFALSLVMAWVIYMFYARLRDIGDELRRIRVMYEMEQERATRAGAKPPGNAAADKPVPSDAPYMPKR